MKDLESALQTALEREPAPQDLSLRVELALRAREAVSGNPPAFPAAFPEPHLALLDPFKEEPIWKTLAGSIQDLFFPRKLPPLELTSKPIAVKDPMAVKRGPLSSALSVGAHVLIIGLIVLAIIEARIHARPVIKPVVAENVAQILFGLIDEPPLIAPLERDLVIPANQISHRDSQPRA